MKKVIGASAAFECISFVRMSPGWLSRNIQCGSSCPPAAWLPRGYLWSSTSLHLLLPAPLSPASTSSGLWSVLAPSQHIPSTYDALGERRTSGMGCPDILGQPYSNVCVGTSLGAHRCLAEQRTLDLHSNNTSTRQTPSYQQ